MSRIVYIECLPPSREPKVDESGFGVFCVLLKWRLDTIATIVDPHNWIAYVPAADYDAAVARVRELEDALERAKDFDDLGHDA